MNWLKKIRYWKINVIKIYKIKKKLISKSWNNIK